MRRFAMIGLGLMISTAALAAQQAPATTPPVFEQQGQQTPPPGRGAPQPGRGGQTPTTQPPPGVPGTVVPPAPTPGQQQPRPEPPSTWQNVRIDITIMDSLSADQQQRKSISLLVLDNRSGQVRSMGTQGMINVDATPTVRPDGKIYLRITIEYTPDISPQVAQATGNSTRASFHESLSLILNDGKPLLVSQAADPRTDRKVTIEVTATVQK